MHKSYITPARVYDTSNYYIWVGSFGEANAEALKELAGEVLIDHVGVDAIVREETVDGVSSVREENDVVVRNPTGEKTEEPREFGERNVLAESRDKTDGGRFEDSDGCRESVGSVGTVGGFELGHDFILVELGNVDEISELASSTALSRR